MFTELIDFHYYDDPQKYKNILKNNNLATF